MREKIFMAVIIIVTVTSSFIGWRVGSASDSVVGSAPFCLVRDDGYGIECFHYSRQACQQAATVTPGYCVHRSQLSPY